MSKRQFKSHASSSRAASSAGFGGFGSTSSASTLSYLSEPPILSAINDANVVVAFKNLSKKDATTKSKALEDLRTHIQAHPYEQGGPEEAIIEAWVKFYPRLSIDNSRRVRELSHNLQYELLKASKKRMEKYIPRIVGSWLAGTYDRERPVARAATDGIKSFIDTEEKLLIFWKRCQLQILEYAQEAINETPHTLSDERTMSADDMQAKYFRVVGSSISLVNNLLLKLSKDDISKQHDKYEEFLASNKKLWAFASSEDPFVRKAIDQLLVVCLNSQPEIIEHDLEIISHAFIAEGLRASQASSALHLVQALMKLSISFPHAWTTAYKGSKAPLSKLRHFIVKGSQGGPAEYWSTLRSLLSSLPDGVLPVETTPLLDFLKAFKDGICNREEPRNNATEAWVNYFEVTRIVVRNLKDPTAQVEVFQASIYPVFEQYLHPKMENSKWSLGNNVAAMAAAYRVCATAKDTSVQKSFSEQWNILADDFISRILTSLPEQSKDYHKSQTAIVAEGHRWFGLVSKTARQDAIDDSANLLVLPSEKIITAALKAAVSRNGKPYSAVSIVDSALRLSPVLMKVSTTSLESIKSFMENDLSKLLLSPSSQYLVSILNLVRSFSGQERFFEDVWQSAIDGLLPLPYEENKVKAIIGLISNDAVSKLCQADTELQDFLSDLSAKAVLGDDKTWPLFEAGITFNALSAANEEKLVAQTLQHLDANDTKVDTALQALEVISKKKPDLLRRDGTSYVTLITRLLAMTEISGSSITTRAENLRSLIEQSNSSDRKFQHESPILHVIRDNLETANPQSLSTETLIQQASSPLAAATSSQQVADLLPDFDQWSAALLPLLQHPPSPALAVMRPFAGAVFAANNPSSERASLKASRDIKGYSVPLRMAMYSVALISDDQFSLLFDQLQVELLYLLLVTAELASDQIDLAEGNKLFGSYMDLEAIADVREFIFKTQSNVASILHNARSWRGEGNSIFPEDRSAIIRELIAKLLSVASTSTTTGFYAAKALSHLLPQLVDVHGWQTAGSEEWLTNLGILKTSTLNGLGAVAILTGLQDVLTTSKLVNNLCNRLISDVAGATAQADKTLGLLILLNANLSVYDDGDLPVAQNRLVFAVKQILSWTPNVATTDSQTASEACRALQTLLPAMRDVYGSYWETCLNFCISIWDTVQEDLTAQSLPMIGMSLKLYTTLRNLHEPNDDLEDALTFSSEQVSHCLIKLLKLQRAKDCLPLEFMDDLLSRNVRKIPIAHVKDLSEFYALVASDFRTIQSAAFDVLHKAIPKAQEQISVDTLLEKTDAHLPEELLSLLLDAPVSSSYDEDTILSFPTSIRGYLLSWHLIYDAYSTASYKVRSDYSDILKSENYIGPLLTFMFDVLGHWDARAIDLDKAHITADMIRKYDMWEANDTESNERNMQWLLVNLYYQCLKYTPSLAKNWWVDCKSKQTRIAVESWTAKFFSPLVVEDTLDDVTTWAEAQEPEGDDKPLVVKVFKRSREVSAGYEIDEMMMQIVIRLPATYPLEGVKVEGVNRVAMGEKKWNSWLMITQGVITFSNGSITDGLATFHRNVVGTMKGQTECAICYSIISSDRRIPDKRCQTCKHLFHAGCLFKWFASSSQSTCPLCRNQFTFGVSRGGARASEGA